MSSISYSGAQKLSCLQLRKTGICELLGEASQALPRDESIHVAWKMVRVGLKQGKEAA